MPRRVIRETPSFWVSWCAFETELRFTWMDDQNKIKPRSSKCPPTISLILLMALHASSSQDIGPSFGPAGSAVAPRQAPSPLTAALR